MFILVGEFEYVLIHNLASLFEMGKLLPLFIALPATLLFFIRWVFGVKSSFANKEIALFASTGVGILLLLTIFAQLDALIIRGALVILQGYWFNVRFPEVKEEII